MHMHMIRADNTAQYPNIFRITNLDQKFPATLFYITLKDLVPVLGNPYEVNGHTTDRMAAISIFIHNYSFRGLCKHKNHKMSST